MNPEENNKQTGATPFAPPAVTPEVPAGDSTANPVAEGIATTTASTNSMAASSAGATAMPSTAMATSGASTPVSDTPTSAPTPDTITTTTPDATTTTTTNDATPSLDQIAADLTSAAATNSLDATSGAQDVTTPGLNSVSTPETPSSGFASNANPTVNTDPAANVGFSTGTEKPTATSDAPTSEAPAPFSADATDTASDLASSAIGVTPASTSSAISTAPDANGQLDSSQPDANQPADQSNAKSEATIIDEEHPLVPAEPVPGSIGSAFAYSDTAPGHAAPVGKQGFKKPLFSFGKKSNSNQPPMEPATAFDPTTTMAQPKRAKAKDNIRLIAIIGIAIVLIAVVAIILLFVVNGSSSNNKPTTTPTNNTQVTTTSSLTCTKEGGSDVFPTYGNVISGKESIIAMYTNNVLTDFGTNLSLSYGNEEDANAGRSTARSAYNQKLSAANLDSDPFDSDYNIIDNNLTVTHQAEGDMIDTTNATVLGFYVLRGEVQDDIDTLLDNYESEGYTCVEK